MYSSFDYFPKGVKLQMATDKYRTELDPIGDLYADLSTLVKGSLIKFSYRAEENENFETKKYSDEYLDAVQGLDTFFTYESYDADELKKAGIETTDMYETYINDIYQIPEEKRDILLKNRRQSIIDNYEEPNDYYRELNGLPPINIKGPMIITNLIKIGFEIVDDNETIDFDSESRKIHLSVAQKILESLSITTNDTMVIYKCDIQDEKTNPSRSFLIVDDNEEILYGEAKIRYSDAYNICKFYNILTYYLDIGRYLFIGIEDIQTITSYINKALLVVADDEEPFDYDKMIHLSDALLNNNEAVIGDYIYLQNYFYVTKEFSDKYGVSSRTPIHCITDIYGPRYVNILESTGYIDELIKNNPTDEYLKYIGSKKISILSARTAKNFDLLYIPKNVREFTTNMFSTMYSGCRDYFVNTVFNPYYRSFYDYYDNFIGLAIMHMTVMQVIARTCEGSISRDFYDDRMIQWLFESYGIPYNSNLNYNTKKNLSKNLNMLIMNKGSNKVLYDIAYLLGYHDVQIYKYYLMKERKTDLNGNLIYKSKIDNDLKYDDKGYLVEGDVEVNDLEKMYDLYFQKVELSNVNYEKALLDSSNRVDYDSITQADPLWWDDDDSWDEIYGDPHIYTEEEEADLWQRHYNYVETKYLGVTISYKLSEILYENIMLLRMIFDMKDQIDQIFVTFPNLTGSLEVTLFDAVVFLCALLCKRYHINGEILTTASKILDVNGFHLENANGYGKCDTLAFCFDKVTNAETYKEIIKNPSRYLKPDERDKFFSYFSILTLPDGDIKEKIKAFNEMYANITSLGYFIGRKMAESQNVMEYHAWKGLREALYIGKENADMFQIDNAGTTAKTYLEYLKEMNPALYNIIDGVDTSDEYLLYNYIDHVIYRIERVIDDLNSLYAVNDSNSSVHDYMLKLMKFFKSYTVDFLDLSTQFIFDAKPDNLLKLVEHYKIYKKIMTEEQYRLMYSDVCRIIITRSENEELFFDDFVAFHERLQVNDASPVNNLDCINCRNTECQNFCRNDQLSCQGSYKKDGEFTPCAHYGLNMESFIKVSDDIMDELHELPDKYEDFVSLNIAHMCDYIKDTRKILDEFRVNTMSRNDLINSIVNSVDRFDRIGNNFIHKYGDDFKDTLDKWKASLMNEITHILTDVPFICRNKKYPCLIGGCEKYRKTYEKLRLTTILELYENRHGKLFDTIFNILITEELNEELHLFEKEHFDSILTIDESHKNDLKFADKVILSAYTKTKDMFGMFDTAKVISKYTLKDNLSFKDEVIIIPSIPSEE